MRDSSLEEPFEPISASAHPAISLEHAIAIHLWFNNKDFAMTMDERKKLNHASNIIGDVANRVIGREPKQMGGRHGR